MATENHKMLVRAILTNDYTAFNGGYPGPGYTFNAEDFAVWSNDLDACRSRLTVKGKALSGTVSSAQQAGLVSSNGETVTLTAEGFALAMSLQA